MASKLQTISFRGDRKLWIDFVYTTKKRGEKKVWTVIERLINDYIKKGK